MVSDLILSNIVQNVRHALVNAERARGALAEKRAVDPWRGEVGAVAYLNQGLSFILAAEALYTANSQEAGEFEQFEQIAEKYKALAQEAADNLATNHSHQWTFIQHTALVDATKGTIFELKT